MRCCTTVLFIRKEKNAVLCYFDIYCPKKRINFFSFWNFPFLVFFVSGLRPEVRKFNLSQSLSWEDSFGKVTRNLGGLKRERGFTWAQHNRLQIAVSFLFFLQQKSSKQQKEIFHFRQRKEIFCKSKIFSLQLFFLRKNLFSSSNRSKSWSNPVQQIMPVLKFRFQDIFRDKLFFCIRCSLISSSMLSP